MTEAGPVPPRGSGPVLFPRRTVVIAGIVGLLFIGGGFIATYLIQLYVTFPRPPTRAWNPGALAANGGEQVWLDVDGDRVEAWYLPPRRARLHSPLLIYAHGNGELIDMRAGTFAGLRDAGVGVLQVEYPGYGRSEGSPSDDSLTAAHVAAYDWALADARIDARRIVGYGRSLGGGAIAQLAANRPLAALVLESTFENFEEVVMAYGVPRYLLVNRFDTRAVLAKYGGPLLVLHGTLDRTFDVRNARALAAIAPHATLHLETCGHNDCPARWELVLGFLATNGVCSEAQEATHEPIDC